MSPDRQNRIFVVSQGELKGSRIDAEYYIPSRRDFFDKIKNNKFVKLKTIIKEGSYGILPPGNSYNENNPITFIRATEMSENLNIDFSNALKVPEKYYENSRSRLKKGDILIAVKGATIASQKCICFVENNISNCIINGSIFRFQTIDGVEPKYIAYYLNTDEAKKQMKFSLVANNAVDYLNKDIIENLEVPLPPLKTQQKIVNKMDTAMAEKKKTELESKEILENINNYVLSELGIKLTGENEEKNYFIVNLEDIKHGRIDTSFCKHIIKSKEIKGKYETVKIKDVAQEIKTGLPIRKDQRISDGNIPYYGANGIIGYMNDFTHDGEYLVVSQDGYIGNHYVVSGKFWASNHNRVMKVKNGINIHYVKAILDITDYEYLITGGVIPKLTKESLETIEIPLPPKEIQDKIANEVKSRIEKANELKKQANEIYEQAKNEVEKMILE